MSFSRGADSGLGLRIVSLAMGFFLICMGLSKLAWFTNSEILTVQLREWLDMAGPVSRWYLESVAIPGAPVFARLVPLGELTTGTALLCGGWVRLAAILAFLMVANFHFAADILLHVNYLINGYGPPVLGSLLALAIGGRRLPLSLSR